jgi:hypothetical protein
LYARIWVMACLQCGRRTGSRYRGSLSLWVYVRGGLHGVDSYTPLSSDRFLVGDVEAMELIFLLFHKCAPFAYVI